MNPKMKKAVALTTATKNKLHNEVYLKAALLSRAKEQIGHLLLYLQITPETDRQVYWQQFETSLREYLDLRLSGL